MKSWVKYKSRNNFIVDKKVEDIKHLHQMTPERLNEYKSARFVKLIKRAISKSVFYKRLYANHGICLQNITRIEDINRLPIINKEIVRENISDIITCPKFLMMKGYTSGTSGSPLTVYRSFDSILNEQAYQTYFRYIHGLSKGDPIVSMRGNLDKTKIYVYDKAENILYLSSYNINAQTVNRYIELISEFKPKGILAYPSSLENLCNELHKINAHCQIPIAITSSETLYDFQREKIKESLGANVFDWYGNAERTVAIGQYPDGDYYEVPGYAIVEPYNEELLTTSLINTAFPLIRYHVSDKITFAALPNHKDFPPTLKVSSILGRADDSVTLSDGTKIGRLDIACKGVENLLYAQIHQYKIGAITVNVVPKKSPFQSQLLESNLRKLLGDSIYIDFREVSETDIEKTKAGKYKLVVNKINRHE